MLYLSLVCVYLYICLPCILSACFLCICVFPVSFLSVNGTDFPATFSPTRDCPFLPFEARPLMLHLCTLPCSTVGVLPFLFLPPFFESLSLFPCVSHHGCIRQVGPALNPLGGNCLTHSPCEGRRTPSFQKWGEYGLSQHPQPQSSPRASELQQAPD